MTNLKHTFSLTGYKLLTLLVLSVLLGNAQESSPYSRYGLGLLRSDVFSANKGMGGLAAPYLSAVNINYANPASYASLTRTTFELGASVDGSEIGIHDSVYHSAYSSLSHFAVAFVPNAKKHPWAVCIGLLPYSSVKYNFTQNIGDSTNIQYAQVNTGSGSLYKLFVGGAVKINAVSIGLNIGYIFGKLEYQEQIVLKDSANTYDTRNVTNVNARGFFYNVGVQYQKLLYHNKNNGDDHRTDVMAFVGGYGSTGVKLNAKISSYWDRFTVSDGVVTVADTVRYDFTRNGKINMPFTIGAGAMFGNQRYWLAGVDFKFANWQSFSTPLDNGSLVNSWRVTLGGQITPKDDDRKYLNLVQYRAGFYVGRSEATYQGNTLNEYGGTVGLGIPFSKLSRLNFAAEVGSRGGSSNAIIRETYYRLSFGLVLNDIWFVKRKFD